MDKLDFWRNLFILVFRRANDGSADLVEMMKDGAFAKIRISRTGSIERPVEEVLNSPEYQHMLIEARKIVARHKNLISEAMVK